MNSIDVFKQLIVNSLMNSKDLQEEVKVIYFMTIRNLKQDVINVDL
jgi:hypothetical protein